MRNLRLFIYVIAVLSASTMFASPIRSSLGSSAIKYASGDSRPYDAEVEYLECNKEQYIRTGIMCSSALKIEFKCSTYQLGSGANRLYYGVFGEQQATMVTHDWVAFRGVGNRCVTTLLNAIDVPFECSIDFGNRTIIKNEKVIYNGSGNPLPLYTSNYEAVCLAKTNYGKLAENCLFGKCYYFRIFENGELVRDFFPVRFKNAQGLSEGGFYDNVSRKIFRNAGTGSFIIGPDK